MVKAGTRLYVHLAADLDTAAYLDRWERGREPDRSPYGFHHAIRFGWAVRFSRPRPPRKRPWRGLLAAVDRVTSGIDVWHAWRNRRAIAQADVIWTMLEREAFGVAALMALRLVPRKPLISGAVWIFNDWDRMSPWRQKILRRLARFCSVFAVHAEGCLPIAERAMPELDTRLMYFGVSAESFPLRAPKKVSARPTVIFAMGNDRTRDWDVLLRAFGNDDRFDLQIVCRWFTDQKASPFTNVSVIRDPSLSEMRGMYARADYAAVTMCRNVFSGVTVALEAAALGVPILATRTGGLATYFADDEMLLAEVGDSTGLRDAVLRQSARERSAMAARAQQRFVEEDYTTLGLVSRYNELTRGVRGKAA